MIKINDNLEEGELDVNSVVRDFRTTKTVKITTQNTIISVMQQFAKEDYNMRMVSELEC